VNAFAASGAAMRPALEQARGRERAIVRAGAFFALAAFASLQYGELLIHPPAGRLFAVAAIVTGGCATLSVRRHDGGPALPGVARPLALIVTLLLALLALGVPAHLLAPAGWSRLGRHVSHGVDGLGAWLWPYRGEDGWSRLAVLLVLPVVLLAAGALCFWPGAKGARERRAAALVLLVALLLTGAANTTQPEPGLRGLVLLVLIAAWLWAPGASAGGATRAARWLILPALLALALRPALSSTSAWIGFREASGTSSAQVTFQWDQVYGPINWPRTEATMLRVAESHPGLLRITSLDRFDGLRFLRSNAAPGIARLDAGTGLRRHRWVTHDAVTVAGLRSRLLVGGDGLALRLAWMSRASPRLTREADGTIAARSVLTSGAYTVTSYRPRPAVSELRRARRTFPRAYLPYARFELPAPSASGLIQPRFAAEASAAAPAARAIGPSAAGRAPSADRATAARVEASPYGPMFRLAQSFAAGAPSAYEVAARIQRYLLANYRYDEHVPRARYPLEAFLFEQRRGYCQQFSGAMTLMLRMDGIPARVASGFKPTIYDPVSGTWKIRAVDAHSWVEVFFTGVGWVSFDPTPAAPIALPGAASSSSKKNEILGGESSSSARAGRLAGGAGTVASVPHAGGGSIGLDIALAAAVLAALALAGVWLRGHLRLRRALTGEGAGAVAELRRVLDKLGGTARTTTLAQLERRLREDGAEGAAGYLAALGNRRYGPPGGRREPRGRAALRRALIARSPRGALKVVLQMPPGAMRRDARPGRTSAG
jgi:protein-glutamine gamma-glutamyltransferase